jgi:S1-C subfamily serine protease
MSFQREDWGGVIGGVIGVFILLSFFFIGKQSEISLSSLMVSVEESVPLPHPVVEEKKEYPQEVALTEEEVKKDEESLSPVSESSLPASSAPPLSVGVSSSPSPATFSLSTINESTRNAAVNLLCLPKEGRSYGVSGSGIIIDPRGIILTNAHVAYNLLYIDYPKKGSFDCEIRMGNPATSKYRAKLIFLPYVWAADNAEALKGSEPSGTGENDYALLAITETTNGSPLPSTFPFIPFGGEYDLSPGNTVVVAGYPAGFLSGEVIAHTLPLTSAYATVKDIFTFAQTTVDVLSLGGSPVAQQGVSGSAIVDDRGNVAGIAVTSSQETDTSKRDLRAITTRHIKRSFAAHAGMKLSEFLGYAPQTLVTRFQEQDASALFELLKHSTLK